jgi:predicted esterase
MKFPSPIGWTTCTIAALIVLVAHATYAAEPNEDSDGQVLLRDSFEEGDRQPAGWQEGAAVPGVDYVWGRREASDGQRSLGLEKSARRYFPIAQWLRIMPLERSAPALQVTVNVKARGATKAIVDAMFFDDRGEPISHEWLAYIGAKDAGDPPVSHDWKEYSGTVAIPAATKRIGLGLQIYGPGRVWFDELEARLVDSAEPPAQGSSDAEDDDTKQASADDAIEIKVRGNATGRYLFVGPESAQGAPQDGYGLLVVLPGGAGTADFHPFVRRIHEQALGEGFLTAQPLAEKWTPRQRIVWPTRRSRVPRMEYSTEELVAAVIEDVAARHTVDRERVYVLAWSSGGPAAYATLLDEESPVRGGLIAMSVFKPNELPPLENARGRGFYLLHSREDRVCPFRMAETASRSLAAAGARTELVEYDGGHGWRGDVFGNIRRGIEWLEANLNESSR